MTSSLRRALHAFGAFWWDFLIGDAPEFAVVTLAIVGLAFLLRHHHLVAAFVLPLVITAALGASVYHGRLRSGSADGSSEVAGTAQGPGASNAS
jgi:cyanate permease